MHEQLNEGDSLSNQLSPQKEPEENEKNLTVEFEDDTLHIAFNHEITQTRERVKMMLDYYQRRFSEREGRLIPREEINVRPLEGETFPVTTHFSVRSGEPLYVGLESIHVENPTTLPKLIGDLEKYKEANSLDDAKDALIQHTISGLRGLPLIS